MPAGDTTIRAYIGLGSNLADPLAQVKSALIALSGIPATRCVSYSSFYHSPPMGPAGQPDYVNAVAALDTSLPAHELLRHLQAIEFRQGRVRTGERWGPRTVDLDLLLYGSEQFHDDILTIPHPGLCERNFVLYPLYEIAPELAIPGAGKLRLYIDQCPKQGLRQVEKVSETVAS